MIYFFSDLHLSFDGRHWCKPRDVRPGDCGHEEKGGGGGCRPRQPGLHQEVLGPGGEHGECEDHLQLSEVSCSVQPPATSLVVCYSDEYTELYAYAGDKTNSGGTHMKTAQQIKEGNLVTNLVRGK